MAKEDATRQGVSDAFHFFLSQHPIGVGELIHDAVKEAVGNQLHDAFKDAVKEAVTEWLNTHGHDLLKTLAADRALGRSHAHARRDAPRETRRDAR